MALDEERGDSRPPARSPHRPDAVLGPVVIDIDALFGPFFAGPAFDLLQTAAGDGLDMHAISGVGGSGRG